MVAQAKLELAIGPEQRPIPQPTGQGAALPAAVRAQMEQAFGADFGRVRVVEDSPAARGLGARAYAIGDELHFAPGQYAPGTAAGDALIGHELAHVVQQRTGRVNGAASGVGFTLDAGLEAEADAHGALAARGERVAPAAERAPAASVAGVVAQALLLVDLGEGLWMAAIDALRLPNAVRIGQRCRDGQRYYTVMGEVQPGVLRLRADTGQELAWDVAADAPWRDPRGRDDDDDAPDDDDDAPSGLLKRHKSEAGPDEDEVDAVDDAVLPEERSPRSELVAILGELLSSGAYVFNNPPLDSSGDIYHTLGFLAVLRHHRLAVPRVVIGYFAPTRAAPRKHKTEVHADRAVEFAIAIGFGANVTKLAVKPPKSMQMNPKAAATRKAILLAKPDARVLDQKVSTALLTRMMQWAGTSAITDIIAKAFSTYEKPDPQVQQASDAWQDEQLRQITRAVGPDQRLVLFNERIATNQQQHNSEGPEFTAIRKHIDDDPSLAWYSLRSHAGPAAQGDAAVSSPAFAGAGQDGTAWPPGFNTKVQHVQLLTRIKALFGDRLVGIYGSTSGTLDVAALVGIRTLSLHQFPLDARETGALNEQDQRELLMAPFKDVLRRQGAAEALEALTAWIAGTYAGPTFALDEISLRPLYARVTTTNPALKTYRERELDLPELLVQTLGELLGQAGGGASRDALAQLAAVDQQPLQLNEGAATGVGMNCLIHTMVQLAGGQPAAPGPQVAQIRQAMIDTGTARGDEMLDPYQAGAGAALMAQFRRDGGFATQILQWRGGQLLVHPVIGAGPVRLLLHRGNHFVPVWGNNGRAIAPGAVAPPPAAVGSPDDLDPDLQRAISESLT
ncbi:MAG: DUF4157 domain-containing protein [Kofleriaceae bacterium]